MHTTYYHGSQTRITHPAPHRDLCLTNCPATAETYAHYTTPTGGYLHTIELANAWLADEDDLRAAAAHVYARDIDEDEHAFMLADDPQVRAHLAAEGYDGVEYGDHDESGADHDCVRIWNTQTVSLAETIELAA